MEKVQKDINTSMREILVDWLVEVFNFVIIQFQNALALSDIDIPQHKCYE